MAEPAPGAPAAGALRTAIEPTLRDFVRAVVRRRWFVLGGAGLGLVLAFLWVRFTPPEYRATLMIAPTATLAETIPLPEGDERVSDFARLLQMFGSVEVARRLMVQPWVLPALFPESWDAETGTWHPPGDPLAVAERLLAALLGRPGWAPPGAEDLAERLRRRLRIDPVGATAMRLVSLRHRDRATALALLAVVLRTADAVQRETVAARAAAQIAYLNSQLARVTLTEHRTVLATLLTRQERARMLIQDGLPFAAEPIDGPTAPLRPNWPDPVVLLPAAALAGLFLALVAVFGYETWRDWRQEPAGTGADGPTG